MALIELKNICKSYPLDGFNLQILKKISLEIENGEFVAIMGPSGSGKSTLMNILGCLDKPTSGHYVLDGRNVEKLSSDELAEIRNQKIGFVFQGFNLLARTTALENVELPMVYANVAAEEREKWAREALRQVPGSVWDPFRRSWLVPCTKTNVKMRAEAEAGACAGKMETARKAKAKGYDAIHDTVHEMAKDEARHGAGFAGLLKRYF